MSMLIYTINDQKNIKKIIYANTYHINTIPAQTVDIK